MPQVGAQKEQPQELPLEDWLHPHEPDIIFDGSLLPGDPTARHRPPPINPDPANYQEWWRKRHFFPEDDEKK